MNDLTPEGGTALAILEPTALEALFRSGSDALSDIIAKIEHEARHTPKDVETPSGRKHIASLAYKIARSKTALDDAGKKLTEEARAQIATVDAERRKVRDRLDALKAEVRAPLDAWEAAEEARVKGLKDRLERVRLAHTMLPPGATAEQIGALLARVQAIAIDETWAEFADQATIYRDQAVATLTLMQTETAAREAQEAELAALRAEKAAREEADRIAEAKRAEEARLAEAAKQAEADRLAEERAAADRAKRIEEEKAAEAERARLRAEQEAAAAVERERERVAAARRAEEQAEARRAADTAHRAAVRQEIIDAIEKVAVMERLTPETVADALMGGRIPRCKVVL